MVVCAVGAFAVGREDARPSVEGTPPEVPSPPAEENPLDNLSALKKSIATGKIEAETLAAVLAAGNRAGRYADVAEAAEVALGTTASVRAAALAEAEAAARAESRRTGKPAPTPRINQTFYDGFAIYRANARVWNEAGVAYYALARNGDAKECFHEAIKLDPAYDEPHANLGVLLRRKGRYEEALAEYDAALAVGPVNPTTWYNRGVALLRLHRLPEAIASFEKAVAFDGKYAAPVRRLALLWYDLGDYETALNYANKLDYLVRSNAAATAAEVEDAQQILTLCQNRAEGRKATPALTVEGTATHLPPPKKFKGKE